VDKKSRPGEQAVRLCNYLDVYKDERIRAGMEFMEATADSREIERYSLRRGDVIITKDSESPHDIGVPALVEEVVSSLICGYHLAVLRATEALIPEYLFRLFQTPYIRSYLATKAQGVTRFGLSQNAITRCWVPLPDVPEQKAIVAHINREADKIDSVLSKYEKEIGILTEYRAALISCAVTGKISVHSAVVAQPELTGCL
jgi:type I restriction enzyme, S subunit